MATGSRFLGKLPRFLKLSPTLLRSNGVRFSSNLIHDSIEPIRSRIRHDSFITRSFSSQRPTSVDYSGPSRFDWDRMLMHGFTDEPKQSCINSWKRS